MRGKVLISVVLLLPVLAHLGYALANSTFSNYYVTVDEYAANISAPGVRVAGQVVPGTIQWDNASRTMHFQVSGEHAKLDVVYRGPVPDSFRDGVTTILEGARGPNGAFVASGVTVKCPHQYLPSE